MNFDSIEELDAEEITKIYDSFPEGDLLSTTFFVCACKATLGDRGTHLKNEPFYDGWCYERVDTRLLFSETSCREKCFSSFGDYSVAHMFKTTTGSDCYCGEGPGTQVWKCVQSKLSYDSVLWSVATGNDCSWVRYDGSLENGSAPGFALRDVGTNGRFFNIGMMSPTYGSCYTLR